MKSISYKITNPQGLVSRKAAELVSIANRFSSVVTLMTKHGEPADLKSIMNVFDTIINVGENIVIQIEGPDEDKAYKAFNDLLSDGRF